MKKTMGFKRPTKDISLRYNQKVDSERYKIKDGLTVTKQKITYLTRCSLKEL